MRFSLAAIVLLSVCASADPGAAVGDLQAWAAAVGAPGAEPPVSAAAFAAPAASPAPIAAPPTQTVNLNGLLDRHWTHGDSFTDAAGRTSVSATLDMDQGGWLVVVPPGGAAILIDMTPGMSGAWTAHGRSYTAGLQPNLLSEYSSVLSIRDASGAVVWQKSIADLFSDIGKTAPTVTVRGRTYRLFLSHLPQGNAPQTVASPNVGLGFVSDAGPAAGDDRYQFFLYSADVLKAHSPSFITLQDGAGVYVKLAPDMSSLDIAR